MVRHLLSMRLDSGAHFLSFQQFADGEPDALFSCVGVRQKGERQWREWQS